MRFRFRYVIRTLIVFVTGIVVTPAIGHPGSGIVVDRTGNVYFGDTGAGVWKIDREGRLSRYQGPAHHFEIAAEMGDLEMVRLLLRAGARLECDSNGLSAEYYAEINNYVRVLQELRWAQ